MLAKRLLAERNPSWRAGVSPRGWADIHAPALREGSLSASWWSRSRGYHTGQGGGDIHSGKKVALLAGIKRRYPGTRLKIAQKRTPVPVLGTHGGGTCHPDEYPPAGAGYPFAISTDDQVTSSAWSGRSIAELSGQDLVDAVTALIRDTPHCLEQIFGQLPGPSNQPTVQSTHSPSETTVIDQRIPGAWQQARPATPRNRYYPQLPALPNLLPSNAETVLTERHYAPLPRSTFQQPIFPPPAPPPPPPPPPLFASPILSQEGESSSNIDVPPSPPSPNHPPPQSFAMDVPPHLSAAQRAADLAEAKAQLKESKIVGQAIHTATSNIPAANILAADGSNFEI
ncbi:hypothetical protein PTTG_07528 [Puccinia triticina 1-1 BBBD Race 1]|uniref:Uncharacterized protein n=1 Tax=Puccinia triticina (isolate 1-1 / race 1 (BBBD)) TaxID=630390 RepID=A0A180GDY7_PUCT1|nr:hypothetical protein PTTG_07528 [Puccinia triticina 1-1 BBBD Race 1]